MVYSHCSQKLKKREKKQNRTIHAEYTSSFIKSTQPIVINNEK